MLWSALFHAYANGHNGVVKLLLEYGANEDLRDKVTACMLQHVVYNYSCDYCRMADVLQTLLRRKLCVARLRKLYTWEAT